MDNTFAFREIFDRFFWHFYRINLPEYYKNKDIKTQEDMEKAEKDLYRCVQEKLHKDRELI
ncbi:MAG: hypothetical protein V1484_00735 [bacterium]